MSGRAVFRADDGTETDITNAVTILWDGVVGSLDWGSGWWDAEDAGAVAWIGNLMGFKPPKKPGGYSIESDSWSVEAFAEAIATYQRFRETTDANLPVLP